MKNKWFRWLLYGVGLLCVLVGIIYAVGASRSPEVNSQASIEIAKPVAFVYNLVADPRRQKDWFSGIDEVEVIAENPLRYRMRASGFSSEMESTLLIPNQRVVTKSLAHSMGVSGEWDTRFEASGQGTRVIHSARMQFANPFLRFMALMMDANKEELATLEALKRYAESH